MAEVGWKFTSLAGQKAAELSENVTEKVRTLHTVPKLMPLASSTSRPSFH